ncbi:hypothetical protein ILYODFUR_007607 [Ilyodon furcidens]|uniref:Protein-tyrosine phosphatase receptor IA-2 ectodomain domain-containing protein n=1 Tax=Ilyodon furcidens TaxID=33524 RepID=A0ABV0U4N0_9TELE
MEPFGGAPEVKSGPPAPLQKMVGLESVHSITKQGQVPAPYRSEEKIVTNPAKDRSTLRLLTGAEVPDARVDSEIQRWMQGDQPPMGDVQPEEAQKNDIKIKTQLVHVGVKEFSSRGKDRHFGYIITNSDSITNDRASDLMEQLTRRLNLHTADLTQLSVLGPALTFRVGPNPKNVTTADLVQVAGRLLCHSLCFRIQFRSLSVHSSAYCLRSGQSAMCVCSKCVLVSAGNDFE